MFSVIIPVHNKAPHLDRSINSVLNQKFEDFELILIDDASTDGSEEKIKGYQDPRVRLFYRAVPGPGGYAARNLGIEKARREWVVFLDADDFWEDHHLDDIRNAILKFKEAEVISTNWEASRNETRIAVSELQKFQGRYTMFSITDFFYSKSLMWTGAIAIKASLLKYVGGFPEGRCKRGGDMDTWIRCLDRSRQNVFINIVSSVYFKDTVNQVTDNRKNPAMKICATPTLESIRSKTVDRRLLKAIDVYCASFAFNMSVGSLKRGGGLAIETINTIRSPIIKYEILVKIYIYRLLLFFKLK